MLFTIQALTPIRVLVLAVSIAGVAGAGQKGVQEKKKRPAKNSPLKQITDDPTLPRVLLIGDSISIGYTLPLREALKGKANVHRPAANCGPTTRGLQQIDAWLGNGTWDVIHFNWGLHDLKYLAADGKSLGDPRKPGNRQQVPIKAYESNLRRLVKRLQKTGATLIWRQTTPVPEGARGRVVGDAVKYNAVAVGVMKENRIAIDDMFAFARPRLKQIQRPANVHFTPAGSKALAEHSAPIIAAAIDPRSGLRSSIAAVTGLLEKKDYVTAINTSVSPETLERILKNTTVEQLAESFSQKKAGVLLEVLKSIGEVQPNVAASGRAATFVLKQAVGNKTKISFEKVGRRWYIRN